eukprot:1150441-Pelagomonas_calceolata.AAC.7
MGVVNARLCVVCSACMPHLKGFGGLNDLSNVVVSTCASIPEYCGDQKLHARLTNLGICIYFEGQRQDNHTSHAEGGTVGLD